MKDSLRSIRPRLSELAALTFLAWAPSASAVDIPIVNASFEDPAIATGTFETSFAPPGWTEVGAIDFGFRTIGVLDPGGTQLYPGGAPDGENVGVVFLLDDQGDQTQFANSPAGMEQMLGAVLETNTRYVLEVEVGNIDDDPSPLHSPFEFTDFPGYRVELRTTSGLVECDDNSLLPDEGTFLTSTVDITIGDSHPQAGEDLTIRLVNLNAAPGLEVNFDHVRLDARPVPEVPASTLGGSALLCLGLLREGRRRLV